MAVAFGLSSINMGFAVMGDAAWAKTHKGQLLGPERKVLCMVSVDHGHLESQLLPYDEDICRAWFTGSRLGRAKSIAPSSLHTSMIARDQFAMIPLDRIPHCRQYRIAKTHDD